MRARNNQILIRIDDKELKILKKKIAKSKLSQSDYLRICFLNQPIIIFEDTKEFLFELKKIGNNLNQLTRAVNQGKINCKNEIEVLTIEVKKLWQLLKLLKAEKH